MKEAILMRKRLRKKLRIGEFQELGFELKFRLDEAVSDTEVEPFWDAFIGEAVEPRGLMCGGGCGREWEVFVARPNRQSASEDDRHALEQWLQANRHVVDLQIGPLIDEWHSV